MDLDTVFCIDTDFDDLDLDDRDPVGRVLSRAAGTGRVGDDDASAWETVYGGIDRVPGRRAAR